MWNFNVPRGSWLGGFFEIIVKLVKRRLEKILLNASLAFEELVTILIEIEAVFHSWSLKYSYEELSEPLTPSMLVKGKRLLNTNNDVLYDVKIADENTDTLNKRARYLHKLLSYFIGRWRREYFTRALSKHGRRCTFLYSAMRELVCNGQLWARAALSQLRSITSNSESILQQQFGENPGSDCCYSIFFDISTIVWLSRSLQRVSNDDTWAF